MLSSVSGLGRLFNAASSSLSPHTPRGQRQLESVTEEAHTYDLLYPEAGSLRPNQFYTFPFRPGDPSSIAAAANNSDDKGGLNVQYPRDIRVVVGQYIGGNSRLIYDSQPPLLSLTSPPSPSLTKTSTNSSDQARNANRYSGIPKSHTAPHSRQSSFSQVAQSMYISPGSPLSPVNEMSALFGGSRRPNTSDGENFQTQLATEEAKETESMLLSMFGSTGFRAESGTKIHVKPFIPNDSDSARPLSPGASRTAGINRRTPLTRSTTSEDLQGMSKSGNQGPGASQVSHRKSPSILITKIFFVDPEEEESKGEVSASLLDRKETPQSSDNLPQSADYQSRSSREKANQIRTPAFAVAVVIYMPIVQQIAKKPMSARASPALGAGYTQQDPNLVQQLSKGLFDQSVEYVMTHWSMITRALDSLEVIVRCQICNALGRLDVNLPVAPAIISTPEIKPSGKPAKIRPPPRTTLQLPSGALQSDVTVQKAIDATAKRIAAGLQIRMVTTGQDRWGIWREEVRGVERWAGSREQDYFLFNLLTAFLAHHTEWLDLMGSKILKSAHVRRQLQKTQNQHNAINQRTVIVSLDKMAARRLIFLLSAFLPGSYGDSQQRDGARFDFQPSGPTSSTSPSYSSSMSRRQSLRRTMQRLRSGPGCHTGRENDSVIVDFDTATEVSDDRTVVEGTPFEHSLRTSDVRSIRSVALPIAATARPLVKSSSVATTATANPEQTTPIAHFSAFTAESRNGINADWRPGSSGSIASMTLQRTLSRSESNELSGTSVDSHSSGRWFWGSRRGSSTETSETPASSGEALGIYGLPADIRDFRSVNKISHMPEHREPNAQPHTSVQSGDEDRTAGAGSESDGVMLRSASRSVQPSQCTEFEAPFPLDLSVNEDDGVIDVKLPRADKVSPRYGSIIGSPDAARTFQDSFKDRSTTENAKPHLPLQRHDVFSDSVVGGWLRKFHPDISLQAVQPYDTLKEEIKQAMRTEPNRTTRAQVEAEADDEAWQDVCTTIIADTTTFRVTRVTLRRRQAASPHHQADALLGLNTKDNPNEEFREELLTESDNILSEIIEKVSYRSGNSSHTGSRTPSRPSSPPRSDHRSSERRSSVLDLPKNDCKKVVLGALEDIGRGVAAELARSNAILQEDRSSISASMKNHDCMPSIPQSLLKDGVRRWFFDHLTSRVVI